MTTPSRRTWETVEHGQRTSSYSLSGSNSSPLAITFAGVQILGHFGTGRENSKRTESFRLSTLLLVCGLLGAAIARIGNYFYCRQAERQIVQELQQLECDVQYGFDGLVNSVAGRDYLFSPANGDRIVALARQLRYLRQLDVSRFPLNTDDA